MKKLLEDVAHFQLTKQTWPGGASAAPCHVDPAVDLGRIAFLHEELREYVAAVANADLAEQGDALVDLIYVAVGTALMKGLPLDRMWDAVQRANMAKVQVNAPGYKGGLIKPEGWQPPDQEAVLASVGYDPAQWPLDHIAAQARTALEEAGYDLDE